MKQPYYRADNPLQKIDFRSPEKIVVLEKVSIFAREWK